MKNSIRSIALITALTGISAPVLAENTWKDGAKDAWVDGKVETVLLLNTNLNSFDINTDVKNGEVLLTGKVDSEVDKALAQELIAKLDGVESVSNRLSVVNQKGDLDKDNVQTLLDAKIETVVKSKLLFESEVKGMDIEVDVEQGVVTLTGMVNSNAAKDLAGAISKNTNDVLNVENELKVTESKS
ncbi:BON domain-containing protein [uncultured Paraglaciecola sp.]|uniref:BON domain-containing protein n=1 Tax=uncultured Paraglaciecola sp. TaxID=1765024 RepID=UPI00260DD79D|nr:BON domain-containing protein [uncultured Paraglaciecola sp.]